MNISYTTKLVREWGTAKGIIGLRGSATAETQFSKLLEEVEELRLGIVKDDLDESVDAIGDCTVVLILLAEIIGVPFEECLESAYEVISQRTGRMENGFFVKD